MISRIGSHRSDHLLKAEVKTVPLQQCNQTYLNYNGDANHIMYKNGIRESQYCAHNPDERNGSCDGDSGGPLQIFSENSKMAHVIGIISIGVGCGGLPTVHTRVAYYADWIERHVWPKSESICATDDCVPCADAEFGCCPDEITPAHGPNDEGCCLNSAHGCCPDNLNSATGPNFDGCHCQNSPFGCCPDNTTAASGYDNSGCGCQYGKYGCCLDKVTPATGNWTT